MWLRLHVSPKKVQRVSSESRCPRLRWLAVRSKERYDRRHESIRLNEAFRAAFQTGELGRIDRFRIIMSPGLDETIDAAMAVTAEREGRK